MFEKIIIQPSSSKSVDNKLLTKAVLNPLASEGSTVIPIAAARQNRPWTGNLSSVDDEPLPPNETCLLCPGGQRANGIITPKFNIGVLFPNDYPILSPG